MLPAAAGRTTISRGAQNAAIGVTIEPTMPPADSPYGSASPAHGSASRGVWRQALAAALRVDWSQAEPAAALRCTVGVAVPLLAAASFIDPAAGLFVAVGAVAAGFGSFQGVYRSRARVMLLAVVGMAVSLFVGSLAGHSLPAGVIGAAVWGFGAGLMVALGPAAAFVALQSAVAAFIAGAFPASVPEALLRAGLVMLGGLAQVALVVTFWPLKRFRAEREYLAGIFRSLADYAAELPQNHGLPPEPHSLARFSPIHRDPQPLAHSSELLVFHTLFDDAERIRTSLAAYSLSPALSSSTAEAVSRILREISTALEEGRAPLLSDDASRLLDEAAVATESTRDYALTLLLTRVRSAFRTAGMPAVEASDTRMLRRTQTSQPIRNAWLTLAANTSLDSAAFRHAVRLAAVLALATALYRIAALPRGYWIPMTALLVLRSEFTDTFVRGTTRVIGTLVGAGIAALLVEWLTTHPAFVTTLLLACVWGGFALFRASYTLFTICITGYIVLLLYLAQVPGPEAAMYRAVNTLAGGALAMLVYRLWPTWEWRQLPDHLAAECEALAADTDLLLGMYEDPRRLDRAALAQSRAAGRRARSNAEASVDRLLNEPESQRGASDAALGLLAAFRRHALAALALHARLEDPDPPPPAPALATVRRYLTSRLRALAGALRDGTMPGPSDDLRRAAEDHARTDSEIADHVGALLESVDAMTAAVDKVVRSTS